MTISNVKTINLTGEVCPYTFVLTKLNLEEIDEHSILEVIVDYPPAVENIPRSVKEQNLGEIVSVNPINENEWKIVIKKY
ncbi:MAG: sulfurtransferase TusA family protein [Candidatus Helarchaeota archaeon]|nr:sulfurtransferase TusA family protein [Candidatus Helarchaeota archaeon]